MIIEILDHIDFAKIVLDYFTDEEMDTLIENMHYFSLKDNGLLEAFFFDRR